MREAAASENAIFIDIPCHLSAAFRAYTLKSHIGKSAAFVFKPGHRGAKQASIIFPVLAPIATKGTTGPREKGPDMVNHWFTRFRDSGESDSIPA